MKIYIASLYGDKELAQRLRDNLLIAGHECTSRWLDGTKGASPGEHRANADMDIEDVKRCDVLVLMAKSKGTMFNGGGRYVEYGYALAIGKPIVILGPIGENVFHYASGDISAAQTHRELVSMLAQRKAVA